MSDSPIVARARAAAVEALRRLDYRSCADSLQDADIRGWFIVPILEEQAAEIERLKKQQERLTNSGSLYSEVERLQAELVARKPMSLEKMQRVVADQFQHNPWHSSIAYSVKSGMLSADHAANVVLATIDALCGKLYPPTNPGHPDNPSAATVSPNVGCGIVDVIREEPTHA